jgi:hypothetical protein
MRRKTGILTFLFIALLASAVATSIKPALAQSTQKPSTPEFTVQLVSHAYDVPSSTTSSVDPYTGKENVVTYPGYHVENRSIEIKISNQPFAPYTDANGNDVGIYYDVRVKGHFSDDWKDLYSPYESPTRDGPSGSYEKSPAQSDSQYTILSLSPDYPTDAKVDFQVQAFEGYYSQYWPYMAIPVYIWVFNGTFSVWSQTQTITIHWNASASTTDTTPNQPTPILTEATTAPNSTPYSTPTSTTPATIAPNPQNQEKSDANFAVTQPDTNSIQIIAFAAVALVIALLLVVIVFMRRRMQVLEGKVVGIGAEK